MTGDILRSYRAPGRVVRALLADGPREDRALVFLMTACFLLFVGQWPALARAAAADPAVPLEARLGGALLATLFLLPLIAYGLALLAHLGLRAAGLPSRAWAARLALFWALLAAAPLFLAAGLVAGFLPGSGVALGAGAAALAALLAIWAAGLRATVLEAGAGTA